MPELTLEDLAARLEALERKVADLTPAPALRPTHDWRTAIGMFGDSDFQRQVDAEGQAIREAERAAVREGGDG